MATYLFDASALCKRYFINETGADIVEALFQGSLGFPVAVKLLKKDKRFVFPFLTMSPISEPYPSDVTF